MEKYIPLAAVLIDTVVGDPRSNYHPVVLIGKLISALETKLRNPMQSSNMQNLAGALLVVVVLGSTYSLTWFIMYALYAFQPLAAFIGGAIMLSFAITPRSLAAAGREIRDYLVTGNLEQARYKVGWIVGRDTEKLTVPEVTRATVETVAENIVDGIISPLFYAALGGVPLACLYRAVNTLDSMVGYKNDKYLHFGMVAARVDDVFNYIPARITGLLLIIAAFILRYDACGAAKMMWRDARKHPSPNSGYTEAGVAGALGVSLGGLNYYGGVASLRATMGEAQGELQPNHINQTNQLMYAVTGLFIIGVFMVQWML